MTKKITKTVVPEEMEQKLINFKTTSLENGIRSLLENSDLDDNTKLTILEAFVYDLTDRSDLLDLDIDFSYIDETQPFINLDIDLDLEIELN